MNSIQTKQFLHEASKVIATRPKHKSTGARALAKCEAMLREASRLGLTNKQTVRCLKAMDYSPLHGVSDSTALLYVIQARAEMNIPKRNKTFMG